MGVWGQSIHGRVGIKPTILLMRKKTKIVVENIRQSDLPEIIELALKTKELHLKEGIPAYYSVEELAGFIKSPHDIYLSAKVDGKLAGFRLASFNPYLKECYLMDLVVKPEYRGQGIATALYKKTFALLNQRGSHWAWVLTHENNKLIQKILKKQGFTKGLKLRVFFKIAPF